MSGYHYPYSGGRAISTTATRPTTPDAAPRTSNPRTSEMGAIKSIAEDYGLTGDDSDVLIEAILDTEVAVRSWAAYLDETGQRFQ